MIGKIYQENLGAMSSGPKLGMKRFGGQKSYRLQAVQGVAVYGVMCGDSTFNLNCVATSLH